jgi:hypothetical protein
MYSQSNKAFVRSTIIDFYEVYGAASTASFVKDDTPNYNLVCPLDDEEAEMRRRNEDLTSQCASIQLERVKHALEIGRSVVHLMVEITYIEVQVIFTLVQLLIPGTDFAVVVKELEFWFMELLAVLIDAMKEIANLLFRVFTGTGGFGEMMKTLVNLICEFINYMVQLFNMTMCALLRDQVAPGIKGLILLLRGTATVLGLDADDAITALDAIHEVLDRLTCDTSWECQQLFEETSEIDIGVLPVTTRCWADYTPGIDDTSSYSCSRSDTCDNADGSFGVSQQIICDSCPRSSNPNINTYACDTYTKRCTCSRPKTTTASCTHNSECTLQGTDPVQCALVSDYSTGRSYGTVECQTCATPVCHITNSRTGVGKCSCMQQNMVLQQCVPAQVLSTVFLNPIAMCAVSSSSYEQRVTSFSAWSSLATAPCAIVNGYHAQCRRTDTMGYLVVGQGVISSTANRRLLGETDAPPEAWNLNTEMGEFDSWNHTADPCRVLAVAHTHGTHLAITEELQLESCVRNRQFGALAIETFNLTTLVDHDHFLMSFTDFASVVTERGVLQQLLNTTGLANFLITQSSVTRPWLARCKSFIETITIIFAENPRSVADALRDAEKVTIGGSADTFTRAQALGMYFIDPASTSNTGVQLTAATTQAPGPASGPASETKAGVQLPHQTSRQSSERRTAPASSAGATPVSKPVSDTSSQSAAKPYSEKSPISTSTSTPVLERAPLYTNPVEQLRHLLQSEDPGIVQYTSIMAATGGFSNIPLGRYMADNWLEGPFRWPIDIDSEYWNADAHCTATTIIFEVIGESGIVMGKFFANYSAYARELTWGIVENIPTTYTGTLPAGVEASAEELIPDRVAPRDNDWASIFLDFVAQNIVEKFLGISPDRIKLFFTSVPGIPRDILTARNIAKDMLICDFESVMLCSRHNRRIFISLILAYFLYVIVSTVMRSVGFPGLGRFMFIFIPFIALWLSYGLSPLCLPMIPTCILSDIIASVAAILPTQFTWPDALQVYPGCLGPKWYDPDATIVTPLEFSNVTQKSAECMLSCRGPPFLFTSWESSLAFVACTLNTTACADLDIPYFPDFSLRAQRYSVVLAPNRTDFKSVDDAAAYTFCFWMTIAQTMPYVLLLMLLTLLAFVIVKLPIIFASTGLTFLTQAIVYTHTE